MRKMAFKIMLKMVLEWILIAISWVNFYIIQNLLQRLLDFYTALNSESGQIFYANALSCVM